MGAVFSYYWGYPDDNKLDTATGLTGKQKRLVRNTWSIIRKDSTKAGVAIMSAYFKKHPEYQQYFAAFKNVPLDELPSNKKFQAHCINVVTALSNAIDALDDPELLEAGLHSLGKNHYRRGQTKEQFHHLKVVVMEILRAVLGSKFTPETEEAWSLTIDATFLGIFKEFSE